MLKLVNTSNCVNYEIEVLENNEFLIEFYTTNDIRGCMSFFYKPADKLICHKHLENIDFLTIEEIEQVHEYFYNEIENEVKQICDLMIKL
jgi:hypothetical protein